MCGIAGVLSFEGGQHREATERMLDVLSHRGPDDCALFSSTHATLGHRRLSIIDLSAAGRQPMVTPDKRYVLTFNGEIYNFRSLRSRLEAQGVQFSSRTDSEVILHGFACWGRDLLEELTGDFAFAVYDTEEQCLFLARDRFGIKPLYFARLAGDGVVFASEIRALLASKLIQPRLNQNVLAHFLAFQSVSPPDTLIAGIEMLRPGHWMTFSGTGTASQRYWHLLDDSATIDVPRDRRAVTADIRRLLRKSVQRQMISDVPLGAFLSGGIDSTAVVGLMSELVDHPIETFAVTFDDPNYEDGHYAQLAARRFQTSHHEVRLNDEELYTATIEGLAAQDHPSGDGINTYIVSRAARTHGLTVALSGLGGDEIFAGYRSFQQLFVQQHLRWMWSLTPSQLRRFTGDMLSRTARRSSVTNKLSAMLRSEGRLDEVFALTRQFFGDDEIEQLLCSPSQTPLLGLLQVELSESLDRPLLSRISLCEVTLYMHDVLLRDTDQMSMAHGLEVRVPLLDHHLANYVAAVTDRHKLPWGTPKRLLVDALEGLLPSEIVNRPKQGFALPFDTWMRGPLKSVCQSGIEALMAHPDFDGDTVYKFWTDFLENRGGLTWSRIWLLVSLGQWLRRHSIIEESVTSSVTVV